MSYARPGRKQPSPAEVLAKAKRAWKGVEELLLFRLTKVWRLPEPKREMHFHPTRQWRFDFAWPDFMLAVEVDGITFGKAAGRHQQGRGFENDREKDLAARELGWDVIHFTPRQVRNDEAARMIARALERRAGAGVRA